jgi:hypothetical protein
MLSSIGTEWPSSLKRLFLLTALLLTSVAEPHKRPVRIAFSRTSTVAATEIRKALADTCPNLQLTTDPLRSEYALEAMAGTINVVFPAEVTRYRFTLFDRSGNAFFSTAPHKFSNGIHNVCMAIDSKSEGRDVEMDDDEPSVESTGPTLY